ncbi:MAG: organic solvent tolerance protein OstA [Bacteroidetes bacterium]|nr:organic solvent tolerance protein OstA [Bacteroidota bacterium]
MKQPVRLSLCLLMLMLAMGVHGQQQQKTIIHIERARTQEYDERLGKDIERLIGNVILRQDSTRFYCDSAHLNQKTRNFNAYGHVHINVNDSLDMFSDRLIYNGITRMAEMFDSVRLIDGLTVLKTQYLLYNRLTQVASYPDNGFITSEDNNLTSKKGYYDTNKKEFYFRDDVVMANPEYTAYSDTMVYNTTSEISWFYGPTIIRGKENTIYCEYGWYDTRLDQAHLSKRASIQSMDQTLTGDKLFYDRLTGYGNAWGNVNILDTTNKMLIKGDIGKLWEDEGRSFVTGKAEAIAYDKEDSLHMHADTLFLFFDQDKKAKSMFAYYGVKFYRTSIQGKCDSLVYQMADSTIRMYSDPVLWSKENQITSDSIHIAIVNNTIDSLIMYNSAFIASRDTIKGFNQIKGKNMVAYFVENELVKVIVAGNAETIYWVREEDGSLIGIDVAKTSSMVIRMKNNEVQTINYIQQPSQAMFPEKELPPAEQKLKGFRWLEKARPMSKEAIFQGEEAENPSP